MNCIVFRFAIWFRNVYSSIVSLTISEFVRKTLIFTVLIFEELPVPGDHTEGGKTGGGSKVFVKVIQCHYHIWESE